MRAAIHELRNHLSVAMSGIEAFLDRKLEPNDVRLNAIWQALHEVDRLIDDLPNDRAVEFETHVVSIDVCRLIANHVTAMEGFAAERGVRLTTQACDITHADCAQFLGDPVRIAEIITNVLLNAINFTPPTGEVHVDCRRNLHDMQFSVSDAGPGIGREERTHIFERGFRGAASSVAPGSGIGLALVKQFVDRQGGKIDVSDGPLGGATFTVTLPGMIRESACDGCAELPPTHLSVVS